MWRSTRVAAMVLAMAMVSGGVALAQGYNYGRDDYGYRETARVAQENGRIDGSEVAHQDFARRKPFNPYPRGKYAHDDRGYRRELGDKYVYERQYARGYEEGYQRTFGRY